MKTITVDIIKLFRQEGNAVDRFDFGEEFFRTLGGFFGARGFEGFFEFLLIGEEGFDFLFDLGGGGVQETCYVMQALGVAFCERGGFKTGDGFDAADSGGDGGFGEDSDGFLSDLRRTVSELVVENYVGGLREVAAEHGLRLWCENYGHWGFPSEFLSYGGYADQIGGEFWSGGLNLGSIECRAASSAAHIYGKQTVFAEAELHSRSGSPQQGGFRLVPPQCGLPCGPSGEGKKTGDFSRVGERSHDEASLWRSGGGGGRDVRTGGRRCALAILGG